MSGVAPSNFDLGRNRSERARRKQTMQAPTELPLLTRQQLVVFLNVSGFPVSEATLNKLCSQKINQGPPVAKFWGKRPLYEPGPALEWAKSLLRDRPTDITANAQRA